MPTVYSRVIKLKEDRKIPLNFNRDGTIKAGYMIKAQWVKDHNLPLPLVTSIEENGTYSVFDYPEYFSSEMDNIIIEYVRLAIIKHHKNLEKGKLIIQPDLIPPVKRKRKTITGPVYRAKAKK